MDIFTAVADPTRRTIIELLAGGDQLSATSIGSHFKTSLAAISQHLKVLREARAVIVEKQAQQRLYSINPDTMHQLEVWASQMAARYEERFTILDEVLEREKAKITNK
jgi:DNA-binding transcriptional ArsR family regulator